MGTDAPKRKLEKEIGDRTLKKKKLGSWEARKLRKEMGAQIRDRLECKAEMQKFLDFFGFMV